MSEEALIHLDLATRKALITVAAEELIERALESSALICKVNDADSNSAATVAQKAIKSTLNEIEKARKAAKEGPLELGRRIDEAAKAAVVELVAEEYRIGKLTGDFQAAELAKQVAAENAARLEAEALERKRQEELRKVEEARLAEERRLQNEQRAAIIAASEARGRKAKEEAAKLQEEIKRQQEIAAAKNLEQIDAINEEASRKAYSIQQANIAAQPVRAEGQIVKTDWQIEVINGYDLARYHPQCVEIKPRLLEIKQLLNEGVQVRGVKATKIVKSSVRADGKTVEV